MIASIKGNITHKSEDSLIIDVNGIGYHIYTGASRISHAQQGEEVFLFTHLHVREDILQLYGFASFEQLQLFKQLISVSGIGPKTAIAVLDAASLRDLCIAVEAEDHALFTTVPGIGAKTAKRVILELKSKLEPLSDQFLRTVDSPSSGNRSEILAALESLGYSGKESQPYLQTIDIEDMTTEEAIKEILKNMRS